VRECACASVRARVCELLGGGRSGRPRGSPFLHLPSAGRTVGRWKDTRITRKVSSPSLCCLNSALLVNPKHVSLSLSLSLSLPLSRSHRSQLFPLKGFCVGLLFHPPTSQSTECCVEFDTPGKEGFHFDLTEIFKLNKGFFFLGGWGSIIRLIAHSHC
jgi:hypothetical protein